MESSLEQRLLSLGSVAIEAWQTQSGHARQRPIVSFDLRLMSPEGCPANNNGKQYFNISDLRLPLRNIVVSNKHRYSSILVEIGAELTLQSSDGAELVVDGDITVPATCPVSATINIFCATMNVTGALIGAKGIVTTNHTTNIHGKVIMSAGGRLSTLALQVAEAGELNGADIMASTELIALGKSL